MGGTNRFFRTGLCSIDGQQIGLLCVLGADGACPGTRSNNMMAGSVLA